MCKECNEVKHICNGDKMFYESFDELTDDLKEKYCGANKQMASRARKSYVNLINELNKRGHTLMSEYIDNQKHKVLIDYNCGHEQHWIRASHYKNGSGCPECAKIRASEITKQQWKNMTEENKKRQSEKLSKTLRSRTQEQIEEQKRKTRLAMTPEKEATRRAKISVTSKGKRSGENCPTWKGGVTPIKEHFRKDCVTIKQWFKDAKINVDYTCELSGIRGGKLEVHHLYSFSKIVEDAHNFYGISIKVTIGDYTQEELKLLENYIEQWHKDFNNAVVLSKNVHRLFHKIYGLHNNTPEQFEEFKTRYLNGEFDSNAEEIA